MERYRPAIRADLFDRGWDLAQLWADRRYEMLIDVIDHLPRTSHFVEAMAQDDELAAEAHADVANAKPYAPPISEFGLAEEILAQIRDSLGVLNANLINVNTEKGKPKAKPPKPFPRPQTARERADQIWKRERYDDVVAQLTPGHVGDDTG